MKDSYSQYGEDKIVFDYFNGIGVKNGRVLEIGAGTGIKDSNSRLLWEYGWHAVLVEPNADSFSKLLSNYNNCERVDLVNAFVCGAHPGLVKFWHNNDGLATGRKEHSEMHPNLYYGHSYVSSITPYLLRLKFGFFDFVSIDAEGYDFEILQHAPVLLGNAKCVCVEYSVMTINDQRNLMQITDVLKGYGLVKELAKTKGNILMVRP